MLRTAAHDIVRSLLVVALLCFDAPLKAQEPGPGLVSGVVEDAEGRPIEGARVAAETEGGRTMAEAFTTADGRFELRVPPGGPYEIVVLSASHSPASQGPWRVAAGEEIELTFDLADAPIQLPEVEVVSAATLEGVAGSTYVVDEEVLQEVRPVNIGEVLRESPGVNFRDEDAFGRILNIGIRGLDPRRSSRVLLLEDGAPIHLGPYGDPSARYSPPAEMLERVEVLKGSGQILHGPHTVGGVVNFVTPPPPAKPGGTLALIGGSREFRSGHLRLGGTWGDKGVVADYVHLEGDGIRDLDRQLLNDVTVKGVLGLGEAHSLLLKGNYYVDDSHTGESALTQAEFEEDPFQNPFRNNAYFLRRGAAQGIHAVQLGTGVTLTTNAYWQRAKFTTFRQAGSSDDRFGNPGYAEDFGCAPDATGPDDCGNQGRPRTYTFGGVEPRLSAAWRPFGLESYFDAGGRGHIEKVDRERFDGVRADSRDGQINQDNEIRTDAFAVFAQNRFVAGPWSLIPGLRFEYVRSENTNVLQDISAKQNDTKWLPGAGITFNAVPSVTLFAGAHRGFAPPRPADVLNPEPGESLITVDPEVSWNYEVGARALPVPGVYGEATLFRIDFDNQVVRGDLVGSGQTLINGGETLNQGLELAATVDLAEITAASVGLYTRLAYTNLFTAEFDGDQLSSVDGETPIRGNRLPYAPAHQFTGTVGYVFPMGLHLRFDVDHVSDQFADDLNTVEGSDNGQRGSVPDFTLLNAGASYPLASWRITLFADVKNLSDELYITDRQEGIVVGAPRFFQAGARWSF